MKCVICRKYAGKYGHNALPIKKGRCCEKCNSTKVVPARMMCVLNNDVVVGGFQRIEFENNDIDTDRGVKRDRTFTLIFRDGNIVLGEEDFSSLTEAMKKYVHSLEGEQKMEEEIYSSKRKKIKGGK